MSRKQAEAAALHPKRACSPMSSSDVVKEDEKQRGSLQKAAPSVIEMGLWCLFHGSKLRYSPGILSLSGKGVHLTSAQWDLELL